MTGNPSLSTSRAARTAAKYWDVRHPDDDVRKERIDSIQRSSVRLQFIFASQLDDGNTITDAGPSEKARVRITPNRTGSELSDRVRDLRNQIVGFLGADPFDPDRGMYSATRAPPTMPVARGG